ncbi:hypothetical protein C9374_003384 [Naegleria lovaniensis]|uniref:Niemann-Pick C1 N-terminal domain-containing protein n=1 Tax=Naegleria lovaniensis TaxID=51637 RepID=A0AA88KL83_NAELO|nr:uncharacterized protein C9374_013677 [Naegleria lovaniensis]XP_044549562.1 uncharacterized protein C9374_003384 [Naegleria lovaniensis]KAG2372669.1 hypothetical protein C9374_013677 [Naegleria lovaniensis]KAG2385569.1 hypothetical protein C9374_003384 [Naegleria lovaniensis]
MPLLIHQSQHRHTNNTAPSPMKIFLIYSLTLIVLTMMMVQLTLGGCVMTSNGFQNGTDYPTVPWKTPFHLPSDYENVLSAMCPHLASQTVCCNTTQVDKMKDNFVLLDMVFWRCPACVLNMKKMWCDFTCNNQQDTFVAISAMNPIPKYKDYIAQVDFYLSTDFQNDLWANCKDDKMAAQPVKEQYPNVQAFLQGLIQKSTPNPNITYVFQKLDAFDTTSGILHERITITKRLKPLRVPKDVEDIYDDLTENDYKKEIRSATQDRKRVRNLLQRLNVQEQKPVSDQLSYYNGTLFQCSLICPCAYCEQSCGKITPDYTCSMFGLPCYIIVTIGGSILLGLFVIAIIGALFDRGCEWMRRRKSRIVEEHHNYNSVNSSIPPAAHRYSTFN